jgi:hypothetical protein
MSMIGLAASPAPRAADVLDPQGVGLDRGPARVRQLLEPVGPRRVVLDDDDVLVTADGEHVERALDADRRAPAGLRVSCSSPTSHSAA